MKTGFYKSLLGLTILIGLMPSYARAEQKKTKRAVPVTESQAPAKKKSDSAPSEKKSATDTEDGYVTASSTHIDFSETSIDGKMKAPEGFMLQGQQGNSLSQMVKLRSNFRNELNHSRTATKAIVK